MIVINTRAHTSIKLFYTLLGHSIFFRFNWLSIRIFLSRSSWHVTYLRKCLNYKIKFKANAFESVGIAIKYGSLSIAISISCRELHSCSIWNESDVWNLKTKTTTIPFYVSGFCFSTCWNWWFIRIAIVLIIGVNFITIKNTSMWRCELTASLNAKFIW